MADRGRWPGDLYVAGNLSMDSVTLPNDSVGDAQVDSNSPIDAIKLIHQQIKEVRTNYGAAVTSFRQVIHSAYAKGTLVEFAAALAVANTGAATVTAALYKNGVSIMSGAPATLNSGVAAYAFSAPAGLTSTVVLPGDVFEVVVTATAGGGVVGQGLTARLVLREAGSL
jgi:hypothetical protein